MRVKLVSTMFLGWLLSQFATAQHDLNLNPVKVSFPEKPRLKLSSETSPVGPIVSQNYELKGKDYNLVLSSTRLPSMALSFRGADDLYKEASEALLKEHKGARQLSYAPATVAGKSGAEMQFENANGDKGRARFVLVGESLIVAEATWKDPAAAEANRFFESMKIVE